MATTKRTQGTDSAGIVTIEFVMERETKGTYRYAEEVADGATAHVGTLYLRKGTEAAASKPERVRVTIAPMVAA